MSSIEKGPMIPLYISSVSTPGISDIIFQVYQLWLLINCLQLREITIDPVKMLTLFLFKKYTLPLRMARFPCLTQLPTSFSTYGIRVCQNIKYLPNITITAPVSATKHLIDLCLFPDGPKYMQLCLRSIFSLVMLASILAST